MESDALWPIYSRFARGRGVGVPVGVFSTIVWFMDAILCTYIQPQLPGSVHLSLNDSLTFI